MRRVLGVLPILAIATTLSLAAQMGGTPAIEAAFKKAYPDATIKKITKEKENGREQYEIESIDHGKARDLIYLADGKLVEVEEEVAVTEVPAAVTQAVTAKYPKAAIAKAERVTITEGSLTRYELALKGAAVKEVTLTPDGQWVSPKR